MRCTYSWEEHQTQAGDGHHPQPAVLARVGDQRGELEQLQFKLQVLEGRRIELREVADKALEVGLAVLGMTSLPKEGTPTGKVV